MAEEPNKTQRWLDLIALLLGRTVPLGVDEIMRQVPAYAEAWQSEDTTTRESVRRKFERDKDGLRKMGIPIESIQYRVNWGADVLEGYRIVKRDFYLPYLRVVGGDTEAPVQRGGDIGLLREEAETLLEAVRRIERLPAFPLAAEARSAVSKLEFDLDADPFPTPPIVWVESPGAAEVLERLRVLTDALLAGKRVAFRYSAIGQGTPMERDVEPYGLFFQRDWYLVGRDLMRAALRVFRVSRMENIRPNGSNSRRRDYEVPADFDLRTFVGRPPWLLDGSDPISATVRFRFPSSLLAERNCLGEFVSEEPGGTSVRRFEVSDPDPFLLWVLGFAGEATIVDPPELRAAFRMLAASSISRYERRHA